MHDSEPMMMDKPSLRLGGWLPANTLSNQHNDNNSNKHHCQFRATTSHTTATATAAMDIDDWQSIEDTGVTPASVGDRVVW